ncbi:MAG TPA: carboxypeptidase-like regulatory domain-containing protein [Silvibacterium sp.]|nr:carboxypeptidase-like regulatory domain-containing protein [Silvibacterium sp.]
MNPIVPCCRVVLAAALAIPCMLSAQETGRGRKYVPPPPTAKITVTVTKAANGKPVENAAVVFHPIKNGKDEGGLELKTDENGKAKLDVIPIGDTLRLQVIALGYQTFGNDYPVNADTREISVKLRRPAKQYSIYQQHSDQQVGGPTPEEQPAKPH